MHRRLVYIYLLNVPSFNKIKRTSRLGRLLALSLEILKIFVSRSFDLIEGHWECEKQVVMLGCICKALLREDDVTHLQNGET